MKTKRPRPRKKPTLSQAQRADDDRLRAELRNVDTKKLDEALAKAIQPASRPAR